MMRRTSMFLLLFVAIVICHGCTSVDNTNSNGNANNMNTNTTNANTKNANGSNSTDTSSSSAALSDSDKRFVTEAAKGGMMEIELGRLATQRGESAAVKQFGGRMVNDHTRANNELKQIASSKGITLPTDMDSEGKETIARLSKVKGEEFDRAYMEDMVKDHTKDVSDFQSEARRGADSDVKGFASKTLPTLEEHLRMAQGIVPKEK